MEPNAKEEEKSTSKDDSPHLGDDQRLLQDEPTMLASKFQGDFEEISGERNTKILINLRPYSSYISLRDHSISAAFIVSFSPGYPHICSEIQLVPQGLSAENCDQLKRFLIEQAKIYAKGGSVMVSNLVKDAENFLSNIVPLYGAMESVPFPESSKADEPLIKSSALCVLNTVSEEGGNDSDSDEKSASDSSRMSSSGALDLFQDIEVGEELSADKKKDLLLAPFPESSKVDEPLIESSAFFLNTMSEGSDSSKKSSSGALDLFQVHFLLMASASKGLPQAELASELCNIGVLSNWAKSLAEVPSAFIQTFNYAFQTNKISPQLVPLFIPDDSFDSENASSRSNSRYLNDFEEIKKLGQGAFGRVTLCRNKLDGREYAVKKIRVRNPLVMGKILREVKTLSQLQHQHVVRYYQSWLETSYDDQHEKNASDSTIGSDQNEYCSNNVGAGSPDPISGNMGGSKCLYIQMENCPRTLMEEISSASYGSSFSGDHACHLFRQILEGLAHIHSHQIIHRDLTPKNIFFDEYNNIKIGDFRLAKSLKLEDGENIPTSTPGASNSWTSQDGPRYYTAPEIKEKQPRINEKVDIYSLGVILFELWHPFGSGTERALVLSVLKKEAPQAWVENYQDLAALVSRLMSPDPSDRPSAIDVLHHDLPRLMSKTHSAQPSAMQ